MTWKSNFENLQFINTIQYRRCCETTSQWGVAFLLFIYMHMFNNHICSYERKIFLFHKAFKKLTSVLHQSLLEKKLGPLGWVIYKVIEERRATITIVDQQMQDYLKRIDLYLFFLDKLLLKSWLILELDGGQRLFEESRNTEWQLGDLWEEFCIYTDGQRLELSERMMEVGHSELGLENKRKSKIPVRVFNYVLRFLSIREFRIWKFV